MPQSTVPRIFVSVQFGCQLPFPWISVIYFYFILTSRILFSKTYFRISLLSQTNKINNNNNNNTIKPNNLISCKQQTTWNFRQNWSTKKQEQGAVPVNDHSEMTAESASMQGKASIPALQKAWVHKGQILLLCKAWVPPHPRRMAHKSSTVRVWVCTHPRCTEGFIQLCCLFTLMFIHPDTPISVSTGTNPSLTKS